MMMYTLKIYEDQKNNEKKKKKKKNYRKTAFRLEIHSTSSLNVHSDDLDKKLVAFNKGEEEEKKKEKKKKKL